MIEEEHFEETERDEVQSSIINDLKTADRQHLTWWVCRVNAEGLLDPRYGESFKSKKDCQDACKAAAFSHPGAIFRPAKLGDIYVAKTVMSIVLA